MVAPSQGGWSSFSVPGSPQTCANGGPCNTVLYPYFKKIKILRRKYALHKAHIYCTCLFLCFSQLECNSGRANFSYQSRFLDQLGVVIGTGRTMYSQIALGHIIKKRMIAELKKCRKSPIEGMNRRRLKGMSQKF